MFIGGIAVLGGDPNTLGPWFAVNIRLLFQAGCLVPVTSIGDKIRGLMAEPGLLRDAPELPVDPILRSVTAESLNLSSPAARREVKPAPKLDGPPLVTVISFSCGPVDGLLGNGSLPGLARAIGRTLGSQAGNPLIPCSNATWLTVRSRTTQRWTLRRNPLMRPKEMKRRTSMPRSKTLFSSAHSMTVFPEMSRE